MSDQFAAHTSPGVSYPGFVNFTREEDGSVVITVRGDAKTREGVYVCGYKGRDTGQPGRCTPGDDHCNNYCNSAPEKGPMVDAPKACTHTDCGETVSTRLTADEWAALQDKLLNQG